MKDEVTTDGMNRLSENFASSAQRVLTIDVAKYDKYLEDSDLTPEQKKEFLHAIWSIMMNFVDLGFDVHPLQEVCGKDGDEANRHPKAAFDRVTSDRPTPFETKETNNRTGPKGRLEVE